MAKRTKNKEQATAPAPTARSAKRKAYVPRQSAFSWTVLLQAAVILAAALGIYGPVLHGEWLWDDNLLITENPRLHDLHGLYQIWFTSPDNDYWPLTWTLLWGEWHLWGDDSFPYHAVSLGLHIGSAFLIWRLLGRLGLRWGWLGGLLFVIHPLAVESVAWAAEIKNTLSLPLFLLACDAWLDAEEKKPLGYFKSILFYFAAMLAKTSVIMLPAVLLLYCWWKRQGVTRQEIVRMIPYAVIAAGLGVITILLQNKDYFHLSGPLSQPVELGSPLTRAVRVVATFFFYLGKFVLPVNLLPIYPRSILNGPAWIEVLALACFAVLLAALWQRRAGWGRHVLFGLGFFFINALPVLGLVKMLYFEVTWVADHMVYLPIIGLIGLAVAGIEKLDGVMDLRVRPWAAAALVLIAVFLTWQSWNYATQFASRETLWTWCTRGNPLDQVPHDLLGDALLNDGKIARSIEEYDKAVQANPNDAGAYSNMGVCYLKSGQPDRARECIQRALRIDPTFVGNHLNLGNAFLQLGQMQGAVDEFTLAAHYNPENPIVHFELGTALTGVGRDNDAAAQFEQVMQLDPNYPHVHEALALAQHKISPDQIIPASH